MSATTMRFNATTKTLGTAHDMYDLANIFSSTSCHMHQIYFYTAHEMVSSVIFIPPP